MKNLKAIPKFRSITAECKFWETHDTTHYLGGSAPGFQLRFVCTLHPPRASILYRASAGGMSSG